MTIRGELIAVLSGIGVIAIQGNLMGVFKWYKGYNKGNINTS